MNKETNTLQLGLLCHKQIMITKRASTYCMKDRGHEGPCITEPELNYLRYITYGVKPPIDTNGTVAEVRSAQNQG